MRRSQVADAAITPQPEWTFRESVGSEAESWSLSSAIWSQMGEKKENKAAACNQTQHGNWSVGVVALSKAEPTLIQLGLLHMARLNRFSMCFRQRWAFYDSSSWGCRGFHSPLHPIHKANNYSH